MTLIKYCGNHSLDDFKTTVNSHADYIGVVFYKKSKRHVHPKQVAEWIKEQPLKSHQRLVGIFVNPSITDILEVLVKVNLDVIQCHGAEMPHQILEIKQIVRLPVWKAIHHNRKSIDLMRAFEGYADGFVIDQKKGDQLGGTGESFDWTHVPDYLSEARNQGVICLIAGGINPSNIHRLMSYQPDGIDLSSGIEFQNRKNKQLITQLENGVNQIYAEHS